MLKVTSYPSFMEDYPKQMITTGTLMEGYSKQMITTGTLRKDPHARDSPV